MSSAGCELSWDLRGVGAAAVLVLASGAATAHRGAAGTHQEPAQSPDPAAPEGEGEGQAEEAAQELPRRRMHRLNDYGAAWVPGRAEHDVDVGVISDVAQGWRAQAIADGFNPFGWWMFTVQGNPVGGIEQDTAAASLFDFGVELDLERLAGLDDLIVHASGSWSARQNLSESVGSFTPVNAVFSGDSLRFFELWAEKRWADDRWSVRAGRVSLGWEYGLDYDINTQYLSAAFRLNSFGLVPNTPNFSVIPFSNWGARARWTPDEDFRIQASVMNGYPRDFADDDKHGLDIGFQPDEGLFLISEASWQWGATESQRRERHGQMPGRVAVGAFYDTGEFDDLDGSGGTTTGIGTAYALARQKVWEPEPVSPRGADLWTSVAFSEHSANAPSRAFWSGGAVWRGPLESRAGDSLALGVANTWFSDALTDQSTETVLETAYNFSVSSSLTVTADVQYILQPGGTGDIDDALVLGFLFYVTF